MSRNVRQNHPPARRIKVLKPRVSDSSDESSLNLSDDSGYSGVEDVSDSDEDDDEHVFAVEEAIITKQPRKKVPVEAPRPLDEENDADEEDDDDDDIDIDEDDDEDQEEDDDDDSSVSWQGLSPTKDDDLDLPETPGADFVDPEMFKPVGRGRHVRFAGVPDSDSDSTSTDTDNEGRDFFPDIFVDQNSLDPTFRREIERDEDHASDSSSSFWDHQNQDGLRIGSDEDVEEFMKKYGNIPHEGPLFPELLPDLKAVELDGYETDGDTTEEDVPEPPVRKKQMRRPLSVETSDSDTPRAIRHVRGKPRVAQFNLDRPDNKPIGVIDPKSGKMIIFTPRRTHGLSPESFDFSQDLTACSPIISNPAFVMMGAMMSSNTFGDFVNMQQLAPIEAFYPVNSDALTGEDTDESEYFSNNHQQEDEESQLKLEDFINFGGHSSDEGEEEAEHEWDGAMEFDSSPTRPKTSASAASFATDASAPSAHPLLNHFGYNPEAVGAFRRNQVNQQLINSEVATQDSLAFSGPYHYGTLKGIKSGSLETVTTPITPIRRQKRNSLVGPIGFPDLTQGSPLNSTSQKRKAPDTIGDSDSHKRHRSISDVELLRL